jgi:hypothetical protein
MLSKTSIHWPKIGSIAAKPIGGEHLLMGEASNWLRRLIGELAGHGISFKAMLSAQASLKTE